MPGVSKGEVVRPARSHAIASSVLAALLLLLVLCGASAGPALAKSLHESLRGIRTDFIIGAVLGLKWLAVLFIATWVGAVWVTRFRSRYVIADRHLEVRLGMIASRDVWVPYNRIRKLELHRSPVGNVLGYADLVVDDGSFHPVVLYHLPDPGRFVSVLQPLMERDRKER